MPIFFVAGLVLGSTDLSQFVTLTAASLEPFKLAPGVSKLFQSETKAFLRPTAERIQEDDPAPCEAKAIHVEVDLAGYLSSLARNEGVHSERAKRIILLGLNEAQSLSLCLVAKSNKELVITGELKTEHLHGLIQALGPSFAPGTRVPAAYYSFVEAAIAPAKALGLAHELKPNRDPVRATLNGLSATLGIDLDETLIRPLTGRFLAALITPRAGFPASHFVELQTSRPQEINRLAKALDQFAPREALRRPFRKNEWGFNIGLASVTNIDSALFFRGEPHALLVADGEGAFDVPLGAPTKHGMLANLPSLADLMIAMNLAEWHGLFARVGRKGDLFELRGTQLESWLDFHELPEPKALLTDLDMLTVSLVKSGESVKIVGRLTSN